TMAAIGQRWPRRLNSIMRILSRNGTEAGLGHGNAVRPVVNPAARFSIVPDSQGPITRINNSDDTGMLRDAYRPAYTANKITKTWLARSSRPFTDKATRVSSNNPAKHFCAT